MQLPVFAAAAQALHFDDLHLNPIVLDIGFLQVHWYSLAYIAGILLGWYYLTRLIAQPNAPMARRHADDLVFYATVGILAGGRLAYVFFYQPDILLHPLDILKLWQGGMSFHGGALGVSLGIVYLARKEGLSWLRIHDYVACCAPFGLFFGRIANFVNGELWGRPTDAPWAIIFPSAPDGLPRHPSQLYEAGLEGLVLGLVLAFFFWRTNARNQPGKLVGIFLLGYGLSRFIVEYFREPDVQLGTLSWGLTMGQTLTVPMLIGGLYLVATASKRPSIDAA
ncbi:prolipoprotein diacylglyceryl transferase [Rhizorhabdus dicambivorans]|uniref:Phosphatidylglycerol--prolipoprotein diacylglyceryl transferase n=1 Tax=Rhizorhabdus dicambivorans TaxID=1850238 RepID=A0A2A4FV87_9SPHN|nr:prolipoprotein diacylglyceryl transferase [Rhizorhabdus dicambivorans]ATE64502.1 prolipoprotein diacylglyceryl transferase [Rhizorhabdus dicambivorans]PCE41596.1 prolipoprotein diacylglyceryl transferase [Rhizorhabdus dicambivorans]